MPSTHTGRCLCGKVRYELAGEPARMLNCHCEDCRRASGAGFAAILVYPKEAVRLSGELRYHAVTSDAGNNVERGFCPECGSQVAGRLSKYPGVVIIQAGSLDDPSLHRPAVNVWTRNRPAWDRLDPDIPHFATTAT